MKKTVVLMFTTMLSAQFLMAQIPEGIKFLNYEKNNSAKDAFQKAYDANPKDPQSIYWLGQALLSQSGNEPTKADIQVAKSLYQKGLQEIGSDEVYRCFDRFFPVGNGNDFFFCCRIHTSLHILQNIPGFLTARVIRSKDHRITVFAGHCGHEGTLSPVPVAPATHHGDHVFIPLP